jgi:SagB-type dehydrogenase family enzyme
MASETTGGHAVGEWLELCRPAFDRKHSVARALRDRRSVRRYADRAMMTSELAQLLWAAQGITASDGRRTTPSAGGLYPLETYVAIGAVVGLEPGLYYYEPARHAVRLIELGDRRAALAAAAFVQTWIEAAPIVIGLAAVYARTTSEYGERGRRYVHREVGHAAANVCLQATALGLCGTVVGAFDDRTVKQVMRMADEEEPICLLPLGRVGR